MSATLKLYIDQLNKRMVRAPVESSTFSPPPFYQGNILPVQVQLVEPDPANGPNAVLYPDISNMALDVVMVAQPTGGSVDAPFMRQSSWTKDTTQKTFTANLDFTDALCDSFLSGVPEKNAWL